MASSSLAEEVLVALPASVPPLTAVRSTLLVAAQDSLREAGLFDAYVGCLPPRSRDAATNLVAGGWLPASTALDHYEACDALIVHPSRQVDFGRGTFNRVRGTLFTVVGRVATGVGATPWSLASHVDRIWSRAFQGSAMGFVKTGPKEARVEIAGNPLVRSTYFRTAFRGHFSALLELLCTRCVTTELREGASESSRNFRVQWA